MRLLICTLYFPPCTLTPANRTYSWAKYLHESGIYPVVITRQWPPQFAADLYEERSIGSEVIIEKHPHYEVHYLPFTGNYRTRSLEMNGTEKQKMPRRIFLAVELLFRNTFRKLLPYENLFAYILKYVKDHKTDKLLISGSPFQLFKIGYLVKKKFNIPWIADYRDAWTSGNHNYPPGILPKLEMRSNAYYERKWLRSAESFITVSPYLKDRIEQTAGKKGAVIYNGFFNDDIIPQLPAPGRTGINFLYSGTMYPSQNYPAVVEIFKKLILHYRDKINITLQFLGTGYQNDRFKNDPVFNGFEKHFILADRVSYPESLKVHEAADVFLMLTYQGAKGIATSKIFDYIKFHKPVLLFPSDHDIVEEILTRSGLGIIANDPAILEEKLHQLILEKMANGFIDTPSVDQAYINSFSRKNQAKRLAEIINDL